MDWPSRNLLCNFVLWRWSRRLTLLRYTRFAITWFRFWRCIRFCKKRPKGKTDVWLKRWAVGKRKSLWEGLFYIIAGSFAQCYRKVNYGLCVWFKLILSHRRLPSNLPGLVATLIISSSQTTQLTWVADIPYHSVHHPYCLSSYVLLGLIEKRAREWLMQIFNHIFL